MEVKIWRRRNRVEGEEEDWRDDGWDETVAGGGLSQRPVSGESEKIRATWEAGLDHWLESQDLAKPPQSAPAW